MRAKLAKAVRGAFAERFRKNLPEFRPVKYLSIPSSCACYEWPWDKSIRFYLLVIITSKMFDDRFTLEGIVTEGNISPQAAPLSMEPRLEKAKWFSFRLPFLWRTQGPRDFWWEICPVPDLSIPLVTEESIDLGLRRVDQRVDDAFEKIKEYAIPFFEHVGQTTARKD